MLSKINLTKIHKNAYLPWQSFSPLPVQELSQTSSPNTIRSTQCEWVGTAFAGGIHTHAPWFFLRLWRFTNHLLTYLLTHINIWTYTETRAVKVLIFLNALINALLMHPGPTTERIGNKLPQAEWRLGGRRL